MIPEKWSSGLFVLKAEMLILIDKVSMKKFITLSDRDVKIRVYGDETQDNVLFVSCFF